MIGWLIETLAASTVLMAVVLLVRGRVAALFGARIAYLLWLLPALRMILPPLPESFGPAPLAQLPVMIDLSAFAAGADAAPLAAAPVEAAGFPWMTALLALWLAGAIVHLGFHLLAYRRFVREALGERTDLPELDARGIEVCASKAVEGPFATGIFQPMIVLPHDYRTRYSAEELRLAMRHETVHHDRGDLSINLFALGMLSLHWFNPIAHRAWRAFRADQELACDAAVLEGASPDVRHSYGLALVKSACARTPVAACALTPRDQLKTRLRMMKAGERRGAGSVLALLLVAGGLALTASGGIAAETTRQIRHEVTEKVIEPAAAAVARAIPAPPAPPAPLAPSASATPATPPAPAGAPQAPQAPTAPERADDWREAMEDARQARAEAAQEAAEARREGLREAEAARREAQAEARGHAHAHPHAGAAISSDPVTGRYGFTTGPLSKCKERAEGVNITFAGQAGKSQNLSVSVCGKMMSEVDIARITLDAMTNARDGLRKAGGLTPDQLAKALAAMDREIVRLKDEIG